MARYALIDGYLDAVRDGLHWRRDLDEIVAEMEDHLYSTVEHMCSRGSEPATAQRIALDRFGDPTTVATVYASTINGGLAMPTVFTRRSGTAAIISAGLLTLFGLYWITWSEFVDTQFSWTTTDSMFYMIATLMLMLAFLGILVTTIGIVQRTGSKGILPIVTFVLLALAALGSLLAWFILGWMLLGGIGALCTAIILLRSGLGPTASTLFFGLGFPIGTLVFIVLTSMEFGRVDEWGDYPSAMAIGVGIGCFVTAAGLVGVGRWLRSEEPADIETTPIPA